MLFGDPFSSLVMLQLFVSRHNKGSLEKVMEGVERGRLGAAASPRAVILRRMMTNDTFWIFGTPPDAEKSEVIGATALSFHLTRPAAVATPNTVNSTLLTYLSSSH
jgi:hypothetical protein